MSSRFASMFGTGFKKPLADAGGGSIDCVRISMFRLGAINISLPRDEPSGSGARFRIWWRRGVLSVRCIGGIPGTLVRGDLWGQ